MVGNGKAAGPDLDEKDILPAVMKSKFLPYFSVVLLPLSGAATAASFTPGNLAVLQTSASARWPVIE